MPLNDPFPPAVPGSEKTIYCCKKWVAGELKRFYSRNPCPPGSVQCSDRDPPDPTKGPTDPDCLRRCREERDRNRRAPGKRPGEAEDSFNRCRERCAGGPPPPPDGNGDEDGNGKPPPPPPPVIFCRGGHKVKTGGICPDDMTLRKDPETGINWCCPTDVPPPKPEGCAGGHVFAPGSYERGARCDEGFSEKMIGDERWCCPTDVPPPPVPVGPCVGNGYELPMGTSRCDEGYSIKKDPDTENYWCCLDEDEKWEDPDNPCTEGGHKRTEAGCTEDETETESVEGVMWCCSKGVAPNGNGNGDGEEFEWSEGLQGLLGRIMERANYLLDYPRGLTPQERQGVINYAIESVKSGEKGRIRSKQEQLARAGLLGSGFEFEETARIQRETRGQETEIRRELAIDDLDRRFKELMGTTGMAQGLTGTLMTGEQIPEVLSGARRSEGQAAINALMSLLGGSMGGQGNQYWNAIITQLMGNQGGQQGGGIWDWLPWLLAGTGQNVRR